MQIAACIPSIPTRGELLSRALDSVAKQIRPPDAISVAMDYGRQGAYATRNRAWRATTADFIAFLDDDDYWLPQHLQRLEQAQIQSAADLVYPWFIGNDPFPMFEGQPWDDTNPHMFPICYLVRRELLEDAGGFPPPINPDSGCAGEDWGLIQRFVELGAKIEHMPERTWAYVWHGSNTSGLPIWSNS